MALHLLLNHLIGRMTVPGQPNVLNIMGNSTGMFVCVPSLTNTMAIGVAVGDSPLGPFKDAIGKPLYDGSWDFIDPTVFVDDDGQAYLYWGNPNIIT